MRSMQLPTHHLAGRLGRTLSLRLPLRLPLSLLTLGAALAACRTGADAATGPTAPSVGAASRTAVEPDSTPELSGPPIPDGVVGRWYAGSASPSEYMDPNTGHWYGNGYGSGLSYTFNADGTYARAFLTFVSIGSCGIREFTYTKGTVTVDTATTVLALQPTAARVTWQNTCSGETDSRAVAAESEQLYYFPGTDYQGATALWLRTYDSNWTAFHPLEWYTR